MSNIDRILTFHGTADDYADELVNGKVDVALGGGELGQGFYLGTALYAAKAWAVQMHNCEVVVEFQFDDAHFWEFDIECLTEIEAFECRATIKSKGLTRTYKFSKDVVWSTIVGGPKIYADQHKWESPKGERFLNGTNVTRRKI